MTIPFEILLIEDNEGDVEMTRRAFRDIQPACNLSVVNDGAEALDFLNKQKNFDGAPTPSLMLLDLNMPRMGGLEFLENVKTDAALKVVPVVMFTSSQSPGDIRNCYDHHASAYVVKPFSGKEFTKALQDIVHFWTSLGQLPQVV